MKKLNQMLSEIKAEQNNKEVESYPSLFIESRDYLLTNQSACEASREWKGY